ncbi:MAG: hypothetical protein OHK93_004703 [Ramalina farinacea]|uniref:Uncharacterized protein n=1 Tax=Ramalina farinacea TaxID=258253 RepID=A0AA43QZ29_9LECA|nr:hypothetical protein [Ramalina farinacea]
MTTLALLFNLAQEDFNSQLSKESGRLQEWPELAIVVATLHEGALMPMKFAIWGLFQAIYYMAEHSFTDGYIFLKWHGQRVGIVNFQLMQTGSLQAAGSLDSLNSTDIPGLNITDILSLNSTDVPDLNSTDIPGLEASDCRTVYKPGGEDLSQAGVYVSLASAMAEMAQYGVRDHMPQIWQYLADYRTAIWVKPEARTRPPSMGVGSGLNAAWSAANFITQRQRYAEYTTSIFTDGQELLGRIVVSSDSTPPSLQGPSLAALQGVATT